jgi:hypothetical protein
MSYISPYSIVHRSCAGAVDRRALLLYGYPIHAPNTVDKKQKGLVSPFAKQKEAGTSRIDTGKSARFLPAYTELFNHLFVAIKVTRLEVIKHTTTLTNQLKQATTAVVILLMNLEVIGQIHNACGQDCNLDFRGSRIAFMLLEIIDYFLLFFCSQHL